VYVEVIRFINVPVWQFQYIYTGIYNNKHIITSDYQISDSGSALFIVPSSEEQDVKLSSLIALGKTRKNPRDTLMSQYSTK
jgi:hypothetical protein